MNSPERFDRTILALLPNHDEKAAVTDWRNSNVSVDAGAWLPIEPCLPLACLSSIPERSRLQAMASILRRELDDTDTQLQFAPLTLSEEILPGATAIGFPLLRGRELLSNVVCRSFACESLAQGFMIAVAAASRDKLKLPYPTSPALNLSTSALAALHIVLVRQDGALQCTWERGNLAWLPRKAKY